MQLKLSSVSKKFDHKIILDQASFTFEKGKIYGLLGRNGAGKTTLFNCIARNLTLDSGNIHTQLKSKIAEVQSLCTIDLS